MGIRGILAGAGALAVGAGVLFAPMAAATAPPPHLWVSPAKLSPGKALEFTASCYGTRTNVTSAGLVAPVELKSRPVTGNEPPYAGSGVAGARPGHFTASFHCDGGSIPSATGTATVEFDIVCPKTTSCAPTSTPSLPPKPTYDPTTTKKPKAPQVKVTPKGAPQTGGGE